MDADAKQTIRDELIRRGYTVQDWNDIVVVIDYIRARSWPEWEKDDHFIKSWGRIAAKMIGEPLFLAHCYKSPGDAEAFRL